MRRTPSPLAIDQPRAADIVLPEQFFPTVSALRDPERRLRLAILADALRYFQGYRSATDRRSRGLYEDAANWFASSDHAEPFSFENVCDALGLNPAFLRRGLRRWRETTPEQGECAGLARVRESVRRNHPRSGGSGRSHRRAA